MSLYICNTEEHWHTSSIPLHFCNSAQLACNAVCNAIQVHTNFNGAYILPPHRQVCNSDHAYYYIKNFHQDWAFRLRASFFSQKPHSL